jgi:hypothetical protein
MHPSLGPTAHPRTTHRTLPRRSIPLHKRRTPSTRKPTPRILRARLPPAHARQRILPPNPHPLHISLTLIIRIFIPITTALLPHAHPSPLLPVNRRTRSPVKAPCSRASRTSILASRVGASLDNRYASCWCTGNPSSSPACACAGAIAGRRGSPSVVVLCNPAVGCRLGVYQAVRGTGPRRIVSIYRFAEDGFFSHSLRISRHTVVIFIYHGVDCLSAGIL